MKSRIASTDENPKALYLLCAIVLASLLIRVVALDVYPPGLNSDELLKAFDGASVFRTGMDHHGEPWPLFFRQSGEYSPPLYIYLTGMITSVFGITETTTRLPSALLGTLSVLCAFFFARQAWGTSAGLWSATLVMLSPWCIHYSRIGWEAITLVPLQLAGMALLWQWKLSTRITPLLWAALLWGLTVYAYPTARLTTPLLLLCFLGLNFSWIRRRVQQSLIGCGVFALTWLPMLWAMATNAEAMQARWQFVSIFRRDDWLSLFASSYVQHLSPTFLFWSGDTSPMHDVWGGLALLVLAPFFITGVVWLVRQRTPEAMLVLAWVLIMPIAPSLTFDEFDPHSIPSSLRCIGLMPMVEIISAIGIVSLIRWIPASRKVLASLVIGVAITVNAAVIGYDALVQFPQRSATAWQEGLRETVEFTEGVKADYDRVVFSHTLRLHPIALATYSGIDPGPFSGATFPKYVVPFFHYVPVYGDFGHAAYLQQGRVELGSISRWYHLGEGNNLLVARPGELESEPIKRITLPDGSTAYEIFETNR